MQRVSIVAIVSVVALIQWGCGGVKRDSLPSSRAVTAVFPRQLQSQDPNATAVVPSRPSRPERGRDAPNPVPTLWASDVRVNTLVSNHGVSTAGEPGIAVVPLGSGGSLIAWEDSGGGLIRAARLDASGATLWQEGATENPIYQASPRAVSDGEGGMLVAWIDGRNGGCDSTTEMSCAFYAQRLDSNGKRLWDPDGLPITNAARYPLVNAVAMISDGAQGAYLAWSSGPGLYNCCSFYMQHIGPDGQPLWLTNGIQVSESPTLKTGPGVTGARLVADGNGGAILAWWNQQSEDGSIRLMAQHVDSSGNVLWASDGVQVTFAGAGHTNFDAVTDGSGGVIFAIQSNDVTGSSNTHIYLQRLSASGEVLWGTDGVQFSASDGAQTSPALVADGAGGIFIAWSLSDLQPIGNTQVSVAHLYADGTVSWNTPVTTSSAGQKNPHILDEGDGGVIVGWEDCRAISTGDSDCIANYDLYAQRIGSDGQPIWAEEGFPISTAKSNQGVDYGSEKRPGFEMEPDGNGGVIFLWPDGRNKLCQAGMAEWCDLFAQHLEP